MLLPRTTERGVGVAVGVAAVGSSLATLAAVLGWQRYARRRRRAALKAEAGAAPEHVAAAAAAPGAGGAVSAASVSDVPAPASEYDETLIQEQLSRNYSFLGDEGMQRIRESFVVVVGAGGVGSWAALMLLRSGVGRLRLIDFDQVSLSSLNRHACATLADVGRPKVVCCAQYFAKVAPWAHVEACVDLFRADAADRLLDGAPTYVIDAIDNIDTKIELLRYCASRRLRVFSSMGAGAKADPSCLQISDISTTQEDPLARAVRRGLRFHNVPQLGASEAGDASISIPCVYSTEKSATHLLPLSEEEFAKGPVHELSAFEDFRVRILPVLGPLPAMFGLAAATYVLCDLAAYKLEPLAFKGRRKLYEKLFSDLNVSESRYPAPASDGAVLVPAARGEGDWPASYRARSGGVPPKVRIPFGVNDVAYLFEEVFRGRSVVPPFDTLSSAQLERWDPRRPLGYDNVALFTRAQAREHEQHVLAACADPAAYWAPEVVARVEQRVAEERRMAHWR